MAAFVHTIKRRAVNVMHKPPTKEPPPPLNSQALQVMWHLNPKRSRLHQNRRPSGHKRSYQTRHESRLLSDLFTPAQLHVCVRSGSWKSIFNAAAEHRSACTRTSWEAKVKKKKKSSPAFGYWFAVKDFWDLIYDLGRHVGAVYIPGFIRVTLAGLGAPRWSKHSGRCGTVVTCLHSERSHGDLCRQVRLICLF